MSKKSLYAFIISFLLLLAVIILNRSSFHNMRKYSDEVDHTRQVITEFESISNHFKSAQIYTPAYGDTIKGNFFQLYKSESLSLANELARLRSITADNREQSRLVDSLSQMISAEMPVLLQKNIAQIISSGE